MSFHPADAVRATASRSPSGSCRRKASRSRSRPSSAQKFEELATHYPPEQRKSAVLYALFMVQDRIGYLSANAMRHVAEVIGCTTAEVEDVATYYAMFYKQPVGKHVIQVCRTLSCALKGAERVTEEIAQSPAHQRRAAPTRAARSRSSRSSASAPAIARRS